MEENKLVKSESNGVAVAGFILAFLIPIVGLILSIVGLSKSKQTNSGKGLSIAGIVISSLSMILLLLLIVAGSLFAFIGIKSYDTYKIKDSVKCIASYDCTENSDGTYTCKYEGGAGEETQTITCDEKYINEFNMNDNDNNGVNDSKSDNKELTLSIRENNCLDKLGEYYLGYNTFIINNIKLNNRSNSLKYVKFDSDEKNFYLNNSLIKHLEPTVAILSSVCNYDNHLIISMGWEGYPENYIYNADGKEVLDFKGEYSYSNGLLIMKEHSYKSEDDFYTLTNYTVDLKNSNYEKKYVKTEKIECDEVGYDC